MWGVVLVSSVQTTPLLFLLVNTLPPTLVIKQPLAKDNKPDNVAGLLLKPYKCAWLIRRHSNNLIN